MAYWEFLLQKEGDRDWLPLETAHVEISEGRYRIIAHTSYCETPVDIRLSQLLAASVPPRRKTLKRLGQTNADGLMVVIPFTHLTPGSWTVKCSAVVEAGASAQWEYGVQLQVLAIESGMEYWDTDLDEAAIAADLSAAPQPNSPDTSTASSAESAPAVSDDEVIESSQTVSSPPVADVTFTVSTPLEDLPLRLQLQHQALVAQAQRAIALQGQVMSFSAVEGLPGEATLWMQLRNPETGQVIHQTAKALSIDTLPQRFHFPITLPDNTTTRLLVGELSLWTAMEPPQILAIQGFTVTLNLDALLEVVANQAERSPAADFENLATPEATHSANEAAASDPTATDDSFTAKSKGVSTLSPREIPFRLVYLPSTGLTLPPVIYRPIDKKAVGAPSLPPIGDQPRRERAPRPSETTPAPEKPLTLPPIGTRRQPSMPPPPESSAAPAAPNPAVELPELGRSQPSPAPSTEEPSPSPQPNPEEATGDRQALTFQPDFQGRFWERLSALAEAAQKAAAEYKAQLEAAGVETDAETVSTPEVNVPFPTYPEEPNTLNYEVVVYEPEAASPPSTEISANSAPEVEILQPGEPEIEDLGAIPVPNLVLPQGELIAGTSLPITVRLPLYPRRLAVKVWVTDVQSRTLIDRPRWLMNWTPDAEEQTALLQLQVPLGSIEARFEAIAIDLATQQESYKTSHVRTILPPNLPETNIDLPL